MDLTVANQGGNNNNNNNNNVLRDRDYRKGNWNLQETMVLIEAKKMDDERRMKRVVGTTAGERGKPAELRWKWVEDYCWKNGCLRSQNQCNDKWDNLMRDFKKVREYERRVGGGDDHRKSYWRIEKNERKDNNLPSNMLPQVYEALVAVVERKGQTPPALAVGSGGAGISRAYAQSVVEKSMSRVLGEHSMVPPLQQCPINIQAPTAVLLPFPSPAQTTAEPPNSLPSSQPLPTSDSDTSGYSDSTAKRRKRRDCGGSGGGGGGGGGGVGTSGGGALQEVGSAISKSASIIAEAIQSCEEREERRHRELVSVHERRLQIEESKAEINRQGINGLVEAINNLANSILALAANKNQPPSK